MLYINEVQNYKQMQIAIINGPNLNLIGIRDKEIYGNISFENFLDDLKPKFPKIKLEYYQSNIEGEIIDFLHKIGFSYDGIIINAGGYTHTSVAIADAIDAIKTPVIEVHISNILARQNYRQISIISENCKGTIMGFGLHSYQLAISSFFHIYTQNK